MSEYSNLDNSWNLWKEISTIHKGIEKLSSNLTWEKRVMSLKEYASLHKTTKDQMKAFENKLSAYNNDVNNMSEEVYAEFMALAEQYSQYAELFNSLNKPEEIQAQMKIWEIKNWPKSAMTDISLTKEDLKAMKAEEYLAKNWAIDYYKVTLGSKIYVLRLNTWSESDEVALLDITDAKVSTSEEIVEIIDASEMSTSWNAFYDVEIDWHNAFSTRWETLTETFEDTAQSLWLWAAWSAAAYWTWAAAIKTWMASAAWWAALFSWLTIWTFTVPVWWSALVVWAVWVATTAFVDADLTTARAKKFWLAKKLETVKSYYNF